VTLRDKVKEDGEAFNLVRQDIIYRGERGKERKGKETSFCRNK
jgi:hypothetical protein